MTAVLDKFLLNALCKDSETANVSPSSNTQDSDDSPALALFAPFMTLERLASLSGAPKDVLRGNAERGYLPTFVLGRNRYVNIPLLISRLLAHGVAA
jgi:hypothetical protein